MASPVLCRLVCIVFLLTVPSGAVRTDRGKHGHDALAASSEMKHAGASQAVEEQETEDQTGGCYYKVEGARCTGTINTIMGKELIRGTCQCIGERYSFKEVGFKHMTLWRHCKDDRLNCKPWKLFR
ncbi:unnamed protein product [Symbiodinium microadriaticum]|nr:unnamed protein product [Symbiodinium microadriaticum]